MKLDSSRIVAISKLEHLTKIQAQRPCSPRTSAEIITSIFHELSYSLPMIFNPLLNMLTAVFQPSAVIIPGHPAGPSEILNTMKHSSC